MNSRKSTSYPNKNIVSRSNHVSEIRHRPHRPSTNSSLSKKHTISLSKILTRPFHASSWLTYQNVVMKCSRLLITLVPRSGHNIPRHKEKKKVELLGWHAARAVEHRLFCKKTNTDTLEVARRAETMRYATPDTRRRTPAHRTVKKKNKRKKKKKGQCCKVRFSPS